MNALLLGVAFVGGALLVFKRPIEQRIEATVNSTLNKNWTKFDAIFEKYGRIYGVPASWLKAIALNESRLGLEKSVARGLAAASDIEGSKSSDGLSWGLMQVTIKTARTMDPAATPEKLNNAEYSVNLAARYLKELTLMFSRIESRYTEWVIKSYNQGPGNTRKERAGTSDGFAHEYWDRFQRNLKLVEENP